MKSYHQFINKIISLFQFIMVCSIFLSAFISCTLGANITQDNDKDTQNASISTGPGLVITDLSEISIKHNDKMQFSDFDLLDPTNDLVLEFFLFNNGVEELVIDSIQLTGDHTGDFSLDLPAFSIFPKEAEALKVKFQPETPGEKRCQIVINSNFQKIKSYSIEFNGLAKGGQQLSVKLGQVKLTHQSTVQYSAPLKAKKDLENKTITLTNTGFEPLNINHVKIVSGDNMDYHVPYVKDLLPPGRSLVFDVSFFPQSAGLKEIGVEIESNDSVYQKLILNFSGNALGDAVLTLFNEQTQVDHQGMITYDGQTSIGESVSRQFVIRNTGTAALEITGLQSYLGNKGDFIVENRAMTIEPDKTAKFNITFKPMVSGTRYINVQIDCNDGVNDGKFQFRVYATAFGVKSILVSNGVGYIQENSVNYFPTMVIPNHNVKTYSVKNSGNDILQINSITMESGQKNDFYVTNMKTSVKPGEVKYFSVVFRPVTNGEKKTVLVKIDSDADNNPEFHFYIRGSALRQYNYTYEYRQSSRLRLPPNLINAHATISLYGGSGGGGGGYTYKDSQQVIQYRSGEGGRYGYSRTYSTEELVGNVDYIIMVGVPGSAGQFSNSGGTGGTSYFRNDDGLYLYAPGGMGGRAARSNTEYNYHGVNGPNPGGNGGYYLDTVYQPAVSGRSGKVRVTVTGYLK